MNSSLQVQRQALLAAADWYSLLCSEHSGYEEDIALKDWINSDPVHQWAWTRVEELQNRLSNIPPVLAVDTYERADRPANNKRRTVLKGIAFIAGSGSIAWANYKHNPRMADLYSAIGEVRTIRLEDGSLLTLNSASAVDILFSDKERKIFLRQGEILIETSKNIKEKKRPFIVLTSQGAMRALGTRFSVREIENNNQQKTLLNVYQHSVEVTLLNGVRYLCPSGQGLLIGKNTALTLLENEGQDSWAQKMLVADNMRLQDFLKELGRYRTGFLRCHPAVADYRITGAFKTDNTDQALLALQKSFPVKIKYRSRYWVNVEPE